MPRLLLLALSAALPLCAAVCLRLLIDHTAHEGSHAISLALVEATGAFHLGESLDSRYLKPRAKAELWRKVLCEGCFEAIAAPAMSKRTTFRFARDIPKGLLSALEGVKCDDPTVTQAVGTLLSRGEHVDALERCARRSAEQRLALERVDYFILVRKDLMRWSLARYGRRDAEYLARHDRYPQFMNKPRVEPYAYKLGMLRETALNASAKWAQKLRRACLMLKSGFNPKRVHFVSYERFAEDPKGVAHRMAEALGGATPIYRQKRPPIRTQKVHSTDIATFATNAREIEAMFAPGTFMSFEQVLRGFIARTSSYCRGLEDGVVDQVDMRLL